MYVLMYTPVADYGERHHTLFLFLLLCDRSRALATKKRRLILHFANQRQTSRFNNIMMTIRNVKDEIGQISGTAGQPQGSVRIDDDSRDSGRSGRAIPTGGRIVHPTVFDVLFGRGKPYQVRLLLVVNVIVCIYFCFQWLM